MNREVPVIHDQLRVIEDLRAEVGLLRSEVAQLRAQLGPHCLSCGVNVGIGVPHLDSCTFTVVLVQQPPPSGAQQLIDQVEHVFPKAAAAARKILEER